MIKKYFLTKSKTHFKINFTDPTQFNIQYNTIQYTVLHLDIYISWWSLFSLYSYRVSVAECKWVFTAGLK